MESFKSKNNFLIIKFFLFITILILLISGVIFAKKINQQSEVKSLIVQIEKYNSAINSFTLKYQALPGDVQNTVTYGITENNTDGNFDNYITDRNQNIMSANGEISNFWLHLSSSRMLDEKYDGKTDDKSTIGKTFPLSNLGRNVGILAYSFSGSTYYHIGFSHADAQRIYTNENSLKTEEVFLFDKKIDDGKPLKGLVIAVSGNSLNILKNNECIKFDEYNLSTKNTVCQLRVEIK